MEDAGADMDCYFEFCKSAEGIASNACNNGNVRWVGCVYSSCLWCENDLVLFWILWFVFV